MSFASGLRYCPLPSQYHSMDKPFAAERVENAAPSSHTEPDDMATKHGDRGLAVIGAERVHLSEEDVSGSSRDTPYRQLIKRFHRTVEFVVGPIPFYCPF